MLTCLLAAPLTLAEDKAARQQQLDRLLKQINKLKEAIDVKEDSKSAYIKQLKNIESSIGKVNRNIGKIADQVAARKQELSALRKTRLEHQRKLSRENEYLAEQVYTAFTLGRQERVKLLFSQQNPQTLQRNLVYYEYFSKGPGRTDQRSAGQHRRRSCETEGRIRDRHAGAGKRSQAADHSKRHRLDKDLKSVNQIIASLDKQLKQQGGSLSRLRGRRRNSCSS